MMFLTQQDYLNQIDQVISSGPYTDDWASLCKHETPRWYESAKFGIFIHWGVYSVPAFGNEWYPRAMYQQGSREFEHHLRKYGPHTKFGYKDFIPMFKGERFDAAEWMRLFKAAGARYVMPVAEHHDGFSMFDSELNPYNAVRMGPRRDVSGELRQAAEENGMVFAMSYHRAEHCWFFNGGLDYDSDVANPANKDFYGNQQSDVTLETTHNIFSAPPNKDHCEEWLARVCEMADKYHPQIVWFDWWIHNVGWKPYLKKFAAYYYNRAAEWGIGVAINYKYDAFAYGAAVFDVERGQLDGIRPRLWQTDTAIARNSWGYTENNDFKDAAELVRDLVDIVSKNGCMLLNVGPRADGTITEEDRTVLLSIGDWLRQNDEGIYETTYWQRFGEGPTNIKAGAFTDREALNYTSQDIRFTYKNGAVYAFVMCWPKDGLVSIESMKLNSGGSSGGDFDIKCVTVLGHDTPTRFSRDKTALHVQVKSRIETKYPVCFKIVID